MPMTRLRRRPAKNQSLRHGRAGNHFRLGPRRRPLHRNDFDDGPSGKLTPKLLDLLAAHHIKATFFVIGENVAEHPEIVAREAREGHEIANHSWSHPNLAKMSDDGVRGSCRKTEDAIRSAIDNRPALLRRLMARSRPVKKNGSTRSFGYKIVCGMSIRWIGEGPDRMSSVIASSKVRAPGPSFWPTTFIGHDRGDAMRAEQLEGKGSSFVTFLN